MRTISRVREFLQRWLNREVGAVILWRSASEMIDVSVGRGKHCAKTGTSVANFQHDVDSVCVYATPLRLYAILLG